MGGHKVAQGSSAGWLKLHGSSMDPMIYVAELFDHTAYLLSVADLRGEHPVLEWGRRRLGFVVNYNVSWLQIWTMYS